MVNVPPAVAMVPPAGLVKVVPVLRKVPPNVEIGADTETVPPTAFKFTFKGLPLVPEMGPLAAMIIAPTAGSGVRVKVVAAGPPVALVIGAVTEMVPASTPPLPLVWMVTLVVSSLLLMSAFETVDAVALGVQVLVPPDKPKAPAEEAAVIETLNGSSSQVPALPREALASMPAPATSR